MNNKIKLVFDMKIKDLIIIVDGVKVGFIDCDEVASLGNNGFIIKKNNKHIGHFTNATLDKVYNNHDYD